MDQNKNVLTSPYFKYSLNALQRLITLTNTDKLSSTYGCSHRDYWLYKTSDFPDSVRNFSSHSFALASIHNYFGSQQKIFFANIAKASILFWIKTQHSDGSFDEFYPFERGWVGPTAFTLYSNIEAYKLVKDDFTVKEKNQLFNAVRRSASYIALGDKEGDDLANHHAMAYLALIKSYEILQDEWLYKQALKAFNNYLKYNIFDEGWSVEYDGIDPGYLSASCSFLSKTLEIVKNKEIVDLIKIYSKTLKMFCYPDGCFAGPIGSRNTMHLYPFGFEMLSDIDKNIEYLAKFSRFSIKSGNNIVPDIMSDRYVHYRVEEYLVTDRLFQSGKAKLGGEFKMQSQSKIYLPKAGIYHEVNSDCFLTVNLAKQFVIDFYRTQSGTSNFRRFSYTGIRILDRDGLYTSQYISKKTKYYKSKNKLFVQGFLGKVPTENTFNLIKNLIFRLLLLLCSKSTKASNFLKKFIRKFLMFSKNKQIYRLEASIDLDTLRLEINILSDISAKPIDLDLGTTISDRYVPQSKFSRISDFNLKQSLIKEKIKIKFLDELKNNNKVSLNLKLIE
tara:strand:- start:319 stop:1998 length:1680 start_codon:yes stop_codon:yes gene_type:complete